MKYFRYVIELALCQGNRPVREERHLGVGQGLHALTVCSGPKF